MFIPENYPDHLMARYDINPDGSVKLARAYRKWDSMRQRCNNPKHPAYAFYGGRGVKVCERWGSYLPFLEDMGNPLPGYWLDRIDNAKDYEPGNCRWVTPKESAKNRVQGGVKNKGRIKPGSLLQRCIAAELPYRQVWNRIKWGWPKELALSTPLGFTLRQAERRAERLP